MAFNARVVLALAVVCIAITLSEAAWCHTSSYTGITCAAAKAAKDAARAECLKKLKIAMTLSPVTCKAKGCQYTVTQRVKDKATWTKFSDCEHTTAAYKKSLDGKGASACKKDVSCK